MMLSGRLMLVLFFLISCTTSSLKEKHNKHSDSKNHEHHIVELEYDIETNMSKSDETYWIDLIKNNLESKKNIKSCQKSNECNCILKIHLVDDQEEWSSWKVLVSGLSLGLIPIKFNARYEVSVKSKSNATSYSNTVETWAHIALLPIFFLTSSKQMETRALADEIEDIIILTCND